MILTIASHQYEYDGYTLVPLTDAADEYFQAVTGSSPSHKHYGRYNAPQLAGIVPFSSELLDFAKALDAAEPEAIREQEAIAEADAAARAFAQRAREATYLAQIDALKLDTPLGTVVQAEPFAKPGIKYTRGVRVTTSTGRVLEWYGAEREYCHPETIDGHPVPFGAQEVWEYVRPIVQEVKKAWKGKKKAAVTGGFAAPIT